MGCLCWAGNSPVPIQKDLQCSAFFEQSFDKEDGLQPISQPKQLSDDQGKKNKHGTSGTQQPVQGRRRLPLQLFLLCAWARGICPLLTPNIWASVLTASANPMLLACVTKSLAPTAVGAELQASLVALGMQWPPQFMLPKSHTHNSVPVFFSIQRNVSEDHRVFSVTHVSFLDQVFCIHPQHCD